MNVSSLASSCESQVIYIWDEDMTAAGNDAESSTSTARMTLTFVETDGPINMPFSNQFQIGNPDNEPGTLEVHFDNLLVESLQRESSQQVKKQKKAERRRRVKKEDEHQRIIYRMKAMVHLTRETGKDPIQK